MERYLFRFVLTNTDRNQSFSNRVSQRSFQIFSLTFGELSGEKGLQLIVINDSLFSNLLILFSISMGGHNVDTIPANVLTHFAPMKLFEFEKVRFVLRAFEMSGEVVAAHADIHDEGSGLNAVVLKTSNKTTEKKHYCVG